MCRELKPDVLLLDLEMPVLDGHGVLEHLRTEMPEIAAVVVSAAAQRGAHATLAALEEGAFDFVDKASVPCMQMHELAAEVVGKIRAAAASRRKRSNGNAVAPTGAFGPPELLVIGASTGGPLALMSLLSRIPAGFPAAVGVVQHMPSSFMPALAERIGQSAALRCRAADAREELEPGTISFFHGGRDMTVVRRDGRLFAVPRNPAPGTPHVPSVNALFHSAAETCGARAWGVLLTGMGNDGADGLLSIHRAGGLTVAQDESTCAVYGMPRAAVELGAAFAVLPLHEITRYLCEALGGKSNAAEARA
jgi:two-component system chemotaxis response regulator CheB